MRGWFLLELLGMGGRLLGKVDVGGESFECLAFRRCECLLALAVLNQAIAKTRCWVPKSRSFSVTLTHVITFLGVMEAVKGPLYVSLVL